MMRRRFSIRTKITMGALAPLFIAFVVGSMAGTYIISDKIGKQAQEKVRTDLNAAREVYLNELERIGDLVELTAANSFTVSAVESGDKGVIASMLNSLQQKKELDILTAVDAAGRVIYRAHDPARSGDVRSSDYYFVQQALKGFVITGTTSLTAEQLANEGANLKGQATIKLLPTPHAMPRASGVHDSGLLMISAAPVRDAQGRVIGALYGAVLLNNNNAIVDKIKEMVYEGVQFQGKDVGTATLFMGDTRIATNVVAENGARAIGTRLSAEVFRRVLLEKKKWIGRAFVVNDYYFSAYEPILNLRGHAIGSLYVGMLEKPYAQMQKNLNSILYVILWVTSVIGITVSGFIGKLLARPIRELEKLAHRVAAGERDLRIEVETTDEVGDLADAFNKMTTALQRKEEEISLLHRGLEAKVKERTAELSEKNRQLLQTQAELARAEKLADLGIVAAGVAHEINTPLAIIRGNTEVLEMCLPPDHASREEVDIISRQTERMAKIVGNLLTFARQKSLNQGKFVVHEVMDDILRQIGHQVSLESIRVEREYAPGLGAVRGDVDQLRQVLTNLIQNAVQAMPDGGTLRLATRAEGAGCAIEIADTGKGIQPEHLEKIFTPFFTTKDNGTGLGLSVSYGIVKDHGGDIQVESAVDQGTLFRILLPGQNTLEQKDAE